MQSANREIDLQIDVRDVELGLDTAMPCGLIVNELVSNALKYAFPEGTEGQIKIESRPAGNGRYHLTVADNGVGLGKEAKPVREGSLGTQLVSMLVDQLDGEISYHNGVGTRVEIEFSESEYTERM